MSLYPSLEDMKVDHMAQVGKYKFCMCVFISENLLKTGNCQTLGTKFNVCDMNGTKLKRNFIQS